MRFAAILMLLTSLAYCDEGKNDEALSPEKQMEKAIAAYKEIVTELFQYTRKHAGLPYVPGEFVRIELAKKNKRKAIVKLSKVLAIPPNEVLYKKSKARRIELSFLTAKLMKQGLELEKTAPAKLPEFNSKNKIEDLAIELSMVTLTELINSPLEPEK